MNLLRRTSRFAFFFLVLMAVWLLLSGKFDWFHIGWGVLTASALAASGAVWPRPGRFPLIRFLLFVPWQLWQIFISNLRVAAIVLSPGGAVRPRLLRAAPRLADPRAQTMLGGAITLTPGTLTVDIDETHMIVHALDDASAADIEAGVMRDKVASVFEGVEP